LTVKGEVAEAGKTGRGEFGGRNDPKRAKGSSGESGVPQLGSLGRRAKNGKSRRWTWGRTGIVTKDACEGKESQFDPRRGGSHWRYKPDNAHESA